MEVRIMMDRILSVTVAILTLGISLGFCSEKPFAKNKEKFNVIFIVVDALRADHLSCYGYFRNTSPNIDRLAKEGVLFKNAFSQGSETLVSIPAMFTSLYPGVNGTFQLKDYLSDKFITLPEILRKNGYESVLFGGYELDTLSNFNSRFDKYKLLATEAIHKTVSSVNEKVLAWLSQKHTKPFFLFAHYDYPHSPYNPPAPYDKIFSGKTDADEETKKLVHSFNWFFDFIQYMQDTEKLRNPTKFHYLISQYDGEIKYTDDQIRILLEELNRLKLSKNTLVILTADHGEQFLEHGVFFHKTQLYDELIHVPLIMRLPGIIPRGKKITNLIGHIDIMPTILDLLNIHGDNIMQGHSLTPLFSGENGFQQAIFSETKFYARHTKAIRTNKLKFMENHNFIMNSYSYELYDIEADPKELNNLIDKNPKETEAFKAWLKAYTLSCERIKKSMPGKEQVSKQVKLSQEEKEIFKSLGYMN